MTQVAAIQMSSGTEVKKNLIDAGEYIKIAAHAGAKLIALPENFAIMALTDDARYRVAEELGEGMIQDFLREQSNSHEVWIIAGTIPLKSEEKGKVHAGCLVYTDKGDRVACYNKIHLFDASLERDEVYKESDYIEPGSDIVIVDSPFGRIGLAVCYDLRFPEMFRRMISQGIDMLVIPSAFTMHTGRAHWEPLLRTRAIENQIYVVAPNQTGKHANGRETYGHTMIIDPWGTIRSVIEKEKGYVSLDCDIAHLKELRKKLPCLEHRKIN